MSTFTQDLPGDGKFHRPRIVQSRRVVDLPFGVGGRLEARDLPGVDRGSSVPIGLLQEEVPLGVEGVDLDLVIFVIVAVGIDEDLEVVVLEDDRVVLSQLAPDVGLFQLGGDVEVGVVPEHLHAGPESGTGFRVSLDVHEVVGPGGELPRLIVDQAVDDDGSLRPAADIPLGRGIARSQGRDGEQGEVQFTMTRAQGNSLPGGLDVESGPPMEFRSSHRGWRSISSPRGWFSVAWSGFSSERFSSHSET